MKITPFEQFAGPVEYRFAPIDVGFDLRVQGMAIALAPDATSASYADREGKRYVVEGTCAEVAVALREAGYEVAALRALPDAKHRGPPPPATVWSERTAREWQRGERPEVIAISRDALAARLRIAPKERLTLRVEQDGDLVRVSVLLDGGDLSSEQETVFRAFLEESGALRVLATLPERPATS
jgi:hypothetical protein